MTTATPIACARMYAVAPGATTAWRRLFARVSVLSGIDLETIDHAFPAPLIDLWTRPDLGAAFMCGWPYIRGVADVVPVAAPVAADARAGGRPVYWTDLVIRADSPARTLEDLRGRTVAYTALDSQSGFSALRHFLRGIAGPRPLFGAETGPVTTPRRAIESVLSGQADAAPVDSYAHALMRLHAPELVCQVRIIAQTEPTASPLLVASPLLDPERLARLRRAFLGLPGDPAAGPLLADLALIGFAEPMPRADYDVLEHRARDAERAGITRLEVAP